MSERKRSPSSVLRVGDGSTPWKYRCSFAATKGAHAGLVHRGVDDVVVAQARPSEERDRRADRRRRVEDGGRGVPVDVPAGEGLRAGFHVGLGDVVDADREQLLQLAGVVLVRVDGLGGVAVEVDQHRGVDGHLEGHRAEVAERLLAEQQVLVPHHLPVADLVDAGREDGRARTRPSSRGGRRPGPACGAATTSAALAVAGVEHRIGGQRRGRGGQDAREGRRQSAGVQCLDLSRVGPETGPAQQVGDCRPVVPHLKGRIGAEAAKS